MISFPRAVLAAAILLNSFHEGFSQGSEKLPVKRPETRAASQPAEVVDPNLRGPKGETVYSGPGGHKYYYTADRRKVNMDPRIDNSLKGPKGETVYIDSRGAKYYVNSKGNKTFINQQKKLDKPTEKKGGIRKAKPAPGSRGK